MKVGDMVKYAGDNICDCCNPGLGTVVQVLSGGAGRKNVSAEVVWSNINMKKWHVEPDLEVILSEENSSS
tara:strand:+ start:588 stop:797 length:210 start_codon:yes stop_codon:yes gene_type:complete